MAQGTSPRCDISLSVVSPYVLSRGALPSSLDLAKKT